MGPFTEEHDHLRATLRRYVTEQLAPHAEEWEAAGRFPDEVFRDLGRLGMLGLTMPPAWGGGGGDYWNTVVLCEELCRARSGSVPMAVTAHTDMALPPIAQFGTDEQKARWLAPAVSGERIGAIGITEPEAGSDVANVRTRARRDGDDWILDGEKTFITNGGRASFVTMVVRTDAATTGDPWSGMSVFLVDTDAPGFEVERLLDKVGMRASDTAHLRMTDVRVPGEALLGEAGQGFKQIMWELQGERLAVSLQAVAAASLGIESALAYARQREAFGRPIVEFQALRHRIVDAMTEVEACRSLAYDCADRWDRGMDATKEIAMCKLACARMAFDVADDVLQVHGGFGYSEDSDVARMWRDARVGRIGGGTDEVQREIIARLMGL